MNAPGSGADGSSQPIPQDMQSQWMPNVQSPSHTGRPPMQQPGPYMNGASGQPPPSMNRGPLAPGKIFVFVCYLLSVPSDTI